MQFFFLSEHFIVVLLVACRGLLAVVRMLQLSGISLIVEHLETILRLGQLGLHGYVSLSQELCLRKLTL